MEDYDSLKLGGKAKLLADASKAYSENQRKLHNIKYGITFVEYKFIRKGDHLIMDKELSLESLHLKEGDMLETKLSDTGQIFFEIHSKESARVI